MNKLIGKQMIKGLYFVIMALIPGYCATDIMNGQDLSHKLLITNAGAVGIGIEPSATTTNKLEVQGNTAVMGTITCNCLKVTTTILPWPDYVLNKGFKARSLDETANFIKKNGHLPGIPSAKDIENNGVNIAEMQEKMLKTIEEMTLQMIALKKENDEFRGRLDKLAK